MMQKKFPIILSLNNHYFRAGLATLLSLLDHSKHHTESFFQFFILHENIHPKLQEYAQRIFNTDISSLTFIKLKSEDLKIPEGVSKRKRSLYYKLYIPLLFKEFEKVLYLDSDIILKEDICALFDIMPQHAPLGAVKDNLHKIAREKETLAPASFGRITQDDYDRTMLYLSDPDQYFQDGVLLFNIPALDFNHYQNFLSVLDVSLWHHAQDILNILFQGKNFFFPDRWNWADVPCAYRPRVENSPYLPTSWRDSLQEAASHPALIHYRDEPKPWQRDGRDDDQSFLKYFHQINHFIEEFEKEEEFSLEMVQTLKKKIPQEEIASDEFPIVISYDDKYALYGMSVLYSALKTAPKGTKFAFFVLHDGLSQEKQQESKNLLENETSRLRFMNMQDIIETHNLPVRWHLSKAIYGRLLIPLLFKNAHYVLYLDSDVIIKKDITQITKYMDDTKAIGAVRDIVREGDRRLNFIAPETSLSPYGESHAYMSEEYYHRYALKIENPIEHHFQSGVVLFNLPQITEMHVQKMLNALPQNLWLLDQDILNLVFYQNVAFLDERWNVLCTAYAQDRINILPRDMQLLHHSMRRDPYILHYIARPKPWEEGQNVPFKEDFLQIMREVETLLKEKKLKNH